MSNLTAAPSTLDRLIVRRALISVSDKTGLIEAARQLIALGVELISTGGTAKTLKAEGLEVKDVSELTGFPEMMDGRVKTLHPMVHGGLLFRRDLDAHISDAEDHEIAPIDLLYVNLYPFEETVARGADFATCVENIDIGGPAMLRAAAKNADAVVVCTDAGDMAAVLAEMAAQEGTTGVDFRRRLAAKTYARTAAYDAAISNWYAHNWPEVTPDWRGFGGKRRQSLRYGENPHQNAAFYVNGEARPGIATAEQVQGKELSYNNLNDTDAAFELVAEFPAKETAAVAIIKHANPCGVALGASPLEAYRAAYDCDRTSAFGGIVALNRPLDRATAEAITEIFTEVVIAPDADAEARAVFASKKNLRLLLTGALPDPAKPSTIVKSVAGGLLVQDRDNGRIDLSDLKTVTRRAPTPDELDDLLFAWRVAKHVKSNTIVYVRDGATAGIGAGQMSRIDAARIAARKAEDAAEAAGWDAPRTKGCVAASDAFFPFADGLLSAIEAGATAVIQPGGSIRDEEVIAAADAHGIAMVFTGMRHFRH
jgi:phosphoribosylaminoimidazolecarboxamide formyltransferase/IMP cyclohydrolase